MSANLAESPLEPHPFIDWLTQTLLTQQTVHEEKVRELIKPELTHADIQLLDRHEREQYNEEVTGYNQALKDVLTLSNKDDKK